MRFAAKRLSLGMAVASACFGPKLAEAVIVLGPAGNNFVSASSPVPETIDGVSLDQYVGGFFGFLGTPISSRYFVTANHITGATTGTFTYNNGTSTTTSYSVQLAGVDDDLAIWEIAPIDTTNFSLYAPLYTSPTEIGQNLVVLGNGTSRGAAVVGGFAEGGSTGQTSYGTNTVIATPTAGQNGFITPSAAFGGDFLQYAFQNNSNPNEAIISGGDSGGPDFVLDPATNSYELAGVNSLVDQVDDANGNPLAYALYDDTGYYVEDANNVLQPITPDEAGPLSSYATRISSRLDFIESVTGIPEPASAALFTAALLLRRRRSMGDVNGGWSRQNRLTKTPKDDR